MTPSMCPCAVTEIHVVHASCCSAVARRHPQVASPRARSAPSHGSCSGIHRFGRHVRHRDVRRAKERAGLSVCSALLCVPVICKERRFQQSCHGHSQMHTHNSVPVQETLRSRYNVEAVKQTPVSRISMISFTNTNHNALCVHMTAGVHIRAKQPRVQAPAAHRSRGSSYRRAHQQVHPLDHAFPARGPCVFLCCCVSEF